ncbi:MAG: PepSY-associated TM helix domain-containing protein [Bacteroidales bacterium]|nr:PepSY-associated TM helix domain-containing protein [Bacteroidales bacterium]
MMKQIRKWSRILHRDIGFFFIGTTIVYGLSGIALNHISDWNPNYSISNEQFTTDIDLKKSEHSKENVLKLLETLGEEDQFRQYYYPQSNLLKIFLKGGSSVIVDVETGQGRAEYVRKRAVFYQVNFLHYNPHEWWKWFSDIFAGALILFAITGIFMVRGSKGIVGRGGIYAIAGILIPILFLIFL